MRKFIIFLVLFLISAGVTAAQQNLNYYNRNVVVSRSKTTEDNLPIKVEHQMACTLVGHAYPDGIYKSARKDEKGFLKQEVLMEGLVAYYFSIERCENEEIICYVILGGANDSSGHSKCKFK